MTPDSENFDQLRKLLALKRHEIPPPGYFHGFSREVIVRIKAGEGTQEATGFVFEGSWLRRFWGLFEARPVLAGGFGVAVCGFFVVGALISSESTQISGLTGDVQAAAIPMGNYAAAAPTETAPLTRVSDQSPSPLGATVSTLPGGSLFDEIQRSRAQQGSPFIQTSALGGN